MGWLLILLCSYAFVVYYARWISVHFSHGENQSSISKNREWLLNAAIIFSWSGLIYVPAFLFFKYGLLAAILGLVLYLSINGTLGFVGGMTIVNRKHNRMRVLEQFANLVHQINHQSFSEDESSEQRVHSVLTMFLLHQKLVQAEVLPELDLGSLKNEEMSAMICLAHFATKAKEAADHQKFLPGLDEEDVAQIIESGQVWGNKAEESIVSSSKIPR